MGRRSRGWGIAAIAVVLALAAGVGGWLIGHGSSSGSAAAAGSSHPTTPTNSSSPTGPSTSGGQSQRRPIQTILGSSANKKKWSCKYSTTAATIGQLFAPPSNGLAQVATCHIPSKNLDFVAYEYKSKADLEAAFMSQLSTARNQAAPARIESSKVPFVDHAAPGTCNPLFSTFRTEPWKHGPQTTVPVVGKVICFGTGSTAYIAWSNDATGTTNPYVYAAVYGSPFGVHQSVFFWWVAHHHNIFGDTSDMGASGSGN
jgi:hypothetical protein